MSLLSKNCVRVKSCFILLFFLFICPLVFFYVSFLSDFHPFCLVVYFSVSLLPYLPITSLLCTAIAYNQYLTWKDFNVNMFYIYVHICSCNELIISKNVICWMHNYEQLKTEVFFKFLDQQLSRINVISRFFLWMI